MPRTTKKSSTNYIKQLIIQEAIKQGVPPELALAVAEHESGFNNLAVSPKNSNGSRDHGVFQLNDKYHHLKDVYDPEENIRYGVGMLKAGLRKNNGNIPKTLSDYNAGPNATGKGRKQGDAYAQKVIARMPNHSSSPLKTKQMLAQNSAETMSYNSTSQTKGKSNNNMTPEEVALAERQRINQDYVNALRNAQQAYDWSNAKVALDNYATQYNSIAAQLREAYPTATEEQIKSTVDNYMSQIQPIQDFTQRNIDALNEAYARQNIVDPLIQDYDRRSLELQNQLQQANPYNRIAQLAPIQDLQPIDIEHLKSVQASDRFGAGLLAMQNPNSPRPDYAAMEMKNATQLDQAAKYNQAVALAQQTGIPIEYFLAGAGMDYNALAQLGGERNENARIANMGYQQGVAPQLISSQAGMVNNANTNTAQIVQQAQDAEKALRDYNKERLMREYELAGRGLDTSGTLLNTALSGANAQGVAGISSVAPIYSASQGAITSRSNNIENNVAALQNAALAQQNKQQEALSPGLTSDEARGLNSAINYNMVSNDPYGATMLAIPTINSMVNRGQITPEQAQQFIQSGFGQGSNTPRRSTPSMMMPNWFNNSNQ